MKRDAVRQLATVVGVIATIIVNGLANALPINGQQTGEVSDRFTIYFVPAGYVFAIWGVIYLGLIAYAVYQALPPQRENPRLRNIGWPFAIASAANIIWIFLWHYEQFVLTLPVMLVLLGSLITIYLRLGTGLTRATAGETWAVRVPFSIYLGWITVATVANASQMLYYLGWNGAPLEPQTWATIMLAVAVVLAALMAVTRRDVPYLMVLIWAFVGIALKHAGMPSVAISAWVATGAVVLLVVLAISRMLRGKAYA